MYKVIYTPLNQYLAGYTVLFLIPIHNSITVVFGKCDLGKVIELAHAHLENPKLYGRLNYMQAQSATKNRKKTKHKAQSATKNKKKPNTKHKAPLRTKKTK